VDEEVSYEQIVGERYALYGPIASGGMAMVHFGRLLGSAGFSRTVVMKRLRGEFLESPEFISTLLDEARLVSRIRHPNVVSTLDMVEGQDELFLVMDYVVGESFSRLLHTYRDRHAQLRPQIATGILCGVLYGLHAAHEARDELGEPLNIVHRDVSPQNVLVGVDGHARLLDFGIAKGKGRLQTTRAGQLKGKLGYMAPEQILGEEPDRRTDVYSAAVVLWEALTGRRLFPGTDGGDDFNLIPTILEANIEPPSTVVDDIPPQLDGIVMYGLNREPTARYSSARDFAIALEEKVGVATNRQIGEWVEETAKEALAGRALQLAALERASHERDGRRTSLLDEKLARRRRKRSEKRSAKVKKGKANLERTAEFGGAPLPTQQRLTIPEEALDSAAQAETHAPQNVVDRAYGEKTKPRQRRSMAPQDEAPRKTKRDKKDRSKAKHERKKDAKASLRRRVRGISDQSRLRDRSDEESRARRKRRRAERASRASKPIEPPAQTNPPPQGQLPAQEELPADTSTSRQPEQERPSEDKPSAKVSPESTPLTLGRKQSKGRSAKASKKHPPPESDAEPEAETLIFPRDKDLKGPPQLPSSYRPSSDAPPSWDSEPVDVPVRSNKWVYLVAAVLGLAAVVAAIAKLAG